MRVGSKIRCTCCIGCDQNMSHFNVLVVSLNLKSQKAFPSHHIWILLLIALSNLKISISLRFLVLNIGVIP